MSGWLLRRAWPAGTVLLLAALHSGGLADGPTGPAPPWHEPNTRGPYFDPTMENNVTTTIGRTVELQCRIFQLDGQKVSWFRKQDLHILTLGTHSFTTDSRFKVLHDAGSHDFILRIQAVRTRDAGVYECQVNTEPKLSWPVTLTVQAPHAKVAGPTDLYVQLDSNINLSCELRVLADPPITLTWLRDAAPIDLGSPRAGISIQTERTNQGSSSFLVISRARQRDSGNYTCRPSEGRSAAVRVHVIDDEHPAAMQTAAGDRLRPDALLLTLLILRLVTR